MKIRFIRLLFIALLMAWLPFQMMGKNWTVDSIPVPYLQDYRKHVSDPDQLLSETARAEADAYLDSLESTLGIQSVFIVVGSVPNADCFRFAQDFGNKYGVGTKKDRNGLVIVLAVNDRRYFIAPGRGLEEHLTDLECDDIAQSCIVANMRVNQVDAAVVQTAKAVYWNLKGDDTHYDAIVHPSSGGDDDDALSAILIALCVFGIPIYLAMKNKGNNRGGRGGRNRIDDHFPPFFYGGGGHSWGGGSDSGFGGGFGGGSFGGGSFGGGGSGGGW